MSSGASSRLYCGSDRESDWQARFPGLEVIAGLPPPSSQTPFLVLQQGALALQLPDGSAPWRPEVLESRRVQRNSLLARAVGLQAGHCLRILDAMAGWGSDGLELVALGAQVDLVEASPVVHALLTGRAAASALQPNSLRCADAWDVMAEGVWDVILLDPMFPERGRKGLAKKPMQVLQQLAIADGRPLGDWIERATKLARSRVVVKRRRTEPVFATPAWQVSGTTIRFDIYRPRFREG